MVRVRPAALALCCLAAAPAAAQQAGWHHSPLRGEGDRAALGCALGSDAAAFTCLAVRCEDDFSVGLHIHTSRRGGDAGRWALDVDKDHYELIAETSTAPYNARVTGDITAVLDALRHGAVAYLDPRDGHPPERNSIPLSGSLAAIGQALYFCAPRRPG